MKILLFGGTGLIGNAIKSKMGKNYDVITTRHSTAYGADYQLDISNLNRLDNILEQVCPDIVISSVTGDFETQIRFHHRLVEHITEHKPRLIYISTANVFDGKMSRPWFERDCPMPESDYGKCKLKCEEDIISHIPEKSAILRLSSVWAKNCRRIDELRIKSEKSIMTYKNLLVNITHVNQVADYIQYIINEDLCGIFHVGSYDLTDYYNFQLQVCQKLNITLPNFDIQTIDSTAYQAVLSGRNNVPDNLKWDIERVLDKLLPSQFSSQ